MSQLVCSEQHQYSADIDPKTYNISPEDLERKIEQVKEEGKLNPKAVVMVDFLGVPADADKISEICKKHNLILVEDAAQGTGSIYKGRKAEVWRLRVQAFSLQSRLERWRWRCCIYRCKEIAALLNSFKVHGKRI